jgi:deoxyribonuclease V
MAASFTAADVHYLDDGRARAAMVVYGDASYATLVCDRMTMVDAVAPYRPGAFFERELPALRALFGPGFSTDMLIIDGYVDLDATGRPGLGAHVHAEFGVPVVGVAKTAFRTATHAVEVHRGDADRPLYVTAAGVDRAAAAAVVAAMAGPFRLPDALRRVDSLARRGVI